MRKYAYTQLHKVIATGPWHNRARHIYNNQLFLHGYLLLPLATCHNERTCICANEPSALELICILNDNSKQNLKKSEISCQQTLTNFLHACKVHWDFFSQDAPIRNKIDAPNCSKNDFLEHQLFFTEAFWNVISSCKIARMLSIRQCLIFSDLFYFILPFTREHMSSWAETSCSHSRWPLPHHMAR